jgi:hypothetical protein
MIYLLLFFSLSATFAATKFDASYGVQGRTLPAFGAELYADSGLNFKFWGKKNEPKDVLYGLIRPNVGVSTSGVINSAKAEIEFFPISFIGISAGRQIINSNFDFNFLDCKNIQCQGEFMRNYVESKMVVGYKGWVALGNYKVDTLRSPNNDSPMADWRHVIVGQGGEEVQIEKKLLLGKVFNQHMLGVLIENVQFLGSRERKESFAAVYQIRKNDTQYMMGAGLFHSSQQPMGVIIYFRIHQQLLPSLKLF